MINKNSSISILSPDIIAKIAAGEVVERPASVVKELIENSIDAESTQITIRIENAGINLIEVSDNGAGMSKEDAELAFKQHSTSKIQNLDDLYRISTLGFRGEALSSIAAVSDIKMLTSNKKDSTEIRIVQGTQKITGGSIEQGTIIQVKGLFSRIPARKKFLSSEATEFKHITDIFLKHAVAQPGISFKLIHNTKQIYNLPASQDLRTRVFDIWGKNIAEKTIPVSFDSPGLKIQGLVGHPEIARRNRSMYYLFLNTRPITSNLIGKAVEDAFHATKPPEYKPVFFINIVINPAEIDVNVHPRKMEVKFNNSKLIYSNVKHVVRRALEQFLSNSMKQQFNQQSEKYIEQTENRRENQKDAIKFMDSEPRQYKNTKFRKGLINKSLNFTEELLEPINRIEQEQKDTRMGIQQKDEKLDINQSYKHQQFFNTYILIEKDNKLLFIDQHAADERINYEKIMKEIEKKTSLTQQQLLVPQTIELDPADYELFKENLNLFKKIGLEFEPFGRRILKLSSIPVIIREFDIEAFIKEILEQEIIELSEKEVLHKAVATLACHGSIRAGRKMHPQEIDKMISQLFKCKKPYSCPHGRPIIWELGKYEIEKQFKRTGFY